MPDLLGKVDTKRSKEKVEEVFARDLHERLVDEHYLSEYDETRKALMICIEALRAKYPASRGWRRSDAE
jgi:hypothetical protein